MAKSLFLFIPALFLWVSGTQAAPIVYTGMFSGLNESPSNASPGTGTARVEYDPVAHSLFVDVDFSGLLGTTTVAHIHCCAPPGTNAGAATPTPTFPGFPAGVVAGIYSQLLDLNLESSFNAAFVTAAGGTAADAEAALAAGLAGGLAYFNIHTTAFPGGELRANLNVIPEPATWTLLAFCLMALVWVRKKSEVRTLDKFVV